MQGMRSLALKLRLEGALSSVAEADIKYRAAGVAGVLAGLDLREFGLPGLNSSEVSRVYDTRLVAKNSPARVIYNSIRSGSRRGKCPLCGHREVATLDHFLPKSHFPALTLNPINLVPACTDCNKAKLSTISDTLHPYYDDVEDEQWLKAEVLELSPTAVRFYPEPPEAWPPSIATKVRNHFQVFGLGILYSSQAARVLAGIRTRLIALADQPEADLVKKHLLADAESWRSMELNCWEAALYSALAESQWFCESGFKS